MKLVYIAGPFRAVTPYEVRLNCDRARALAVAVARTPGLFPQCPHTMADDLTGAAPDEVWLEGDLEWMRRCDAVLVVPDWTRSTGTTGEIVEALARGIPVFEAVRVSDDPSCLEHAWQINNTNPLRSLRNVHAEDMNLLKWSKLVAAAPVADGMALVTSERPRA